MGSDCDGPTFRSDPSYPWGTGAIRIPDPDVLWAGPTQKTLRVTTGSCSRFENITSVEVDWEGDFGRKEVEEESGRGDQIGKADSDGGDVLCEGPPLWSDPSYPWGTSALGIPDQDVLWAGTTQQTLPGDHRYLQPLRAIPNIEMDGECDIGRKEVEEESSRGAQIGEVDSDGGDVCGGGGDGSGRTGWSSPVEIPPHDAQGKAQDHQH
ncbi:hypothetical protein NDU88_003673 [Pleurodeles waltl]|uniref:Uncharacterized protein n=1 Tax=Pleurodeles waltl TaxID=8319 RepID=A0AAV7UGT4_PLEWA|nr:hypothetical protein NDU88_003673 [Pleurodeles waltl]